MGGGSSKGKQEVSSTSTKVQKSIADKVNSSSANGNEDGEMVTGIVCLSEDIQDGEMKVFDLGEGKVLIAKEKGELHAIGHKCSHYGAPLINGSLNNGKIRCPWHGACFNLGTGDIEDFPGLDSIAKFQVEVIDGKVVVQAKVKDLATFRRVRPMTCAAADDDERTFLLIGGGGASGVCAETLRQNGFKGKIIIVTDEQYLPYDRPKLSKALDVKSEVILFRKKELYSVHDIQIKTKTKAVSINSTLKCVKFDDESTISYDKLLIATGALPRPSTGIEGCDLENMMMLRNINQAHKIVEHARGKDVVIIGTSFIGLEVAAYLVGKCTSVTLIGRGGQQPLQRVMGEKIGVLVKKMFEKKGVIFYLDVEIKKFIAGKCGKKINEIEFSNNEKIHCELVVSGIGVTPATGFLNGSEIAMNDAGYIMVDKRMQTSRSDIFAAGDVTEFPLAMKADMKVNVQHWQMAMKQGNIAAFNMMNAEQPTYIDSVPFFWTVLFGKSIRYSGYGAGFDDVVIHGDLENLKFVAYYCIGDYVVAVSSLNMDPMVAQAAEYFLSGHPFKKALIINAENHKDWSYNLPEKETN